MTERDIFLTAVEIDDPVRRTMYLDSACGGDAELRRRVEDLLQSHAGAGSFLNQPAPEQVQAESGPTIRPETASPDAPNLAFLDAPARPGSLGRLGHYEILELVGQGAMGIVFKAFDDQLHRVVAVKVLLPELASNALARKRFIREAQAAAAVTHEHVVTIHAVDGERNPPFLVMQYVSGISLQDKLVLSGPLGLREILRIGSQIASGLAAAHRQGLVHRDIKPANILLENGVERVKITDFGLARAVDDIGITQTGIVAGTPQYMSPEQALGESIDHRSDLFSLGGVLYTLCTGRAPFRADSAVAVLRRVCDDMPRPIEEINPEIPRWLVEIVTRLLAKKPADRFQTADEVAELLRSHLAQLQEPQPRGAPIVAAAAPLIASKPASAFAARPARPAALPRLVPWLATLNILGALFLMFVSCLDDSSVLKVETSRFWRTWGQVDTVVGFAMAAAIFAASIGMYLWQPWSRKVLVWTFVLMLATLPIDIPYLAKSAIPQLQAEIERDLSADMSPQDRSDAAGAITTALVGGTTLLGLAWLITGLVYFTRPRVVAAFEAPLAVEPSTPETAAGDPVARQTLWPVWLVVGLVVCLSCCCPMTIAVGVLSVYFVMPVSSSSSPVSETHEFGEPVSPARSVDSAEKGTAADEQLQNEPPAADRGEPPKEAPADPGSREPMPDPGPAAARAQLQGKWLPVSSEFQGEKTIDPSQMMSVEVSGDRWTFLGKGTRADYSYRVDSAKSPWEITLVPQAEGSKPSEVPGAYRLEGETLTVSWGIQERPNGFEPSKAAVAVFKRAK